MVRIGLADLQPLRLLLAARRRHGDLDQLETVLLGQRLEPVIEEALLFIRFAVRQREDHEWADVLPSRAVEQEVLDILDAP